MAENSGLLVSAPWCTNTAFSMSWQTGEKLQIWWCGWKELLHNKILDFEGSESTSRQTVVVGTNPLATYKAKQKKIKCSKGQIEQTYASTHLFQNVFTTRHYPIPCQRCDLLHRHFVLGFCFACDDGLGPACQSSAPLNSKSWVQNFIGPGLQPKKHMKLYEMYPHILSSVTNTSCFTAPEWGHGAWAAKLTMLASREPLSDWEASNQRKNIDKASVLWRRMLKKPCGTRLNLLQEEAKEPIVRTLQAWICECPGGKWISCLRIWSTMIGLKSRAMCFVRLVLGLLKPLWNSHVVGAGLAKRKSAFEGGKQKLAMR